MLAETPRGRLTAPGMYGLTGSWATGGCPVVPWSPSAPMAAQCPLRALSVPQARSGLVLRLLGTPQVQRGRKSERLSLQVAEAGVQRAEGVWGGGWTSQRPVLALAKLPLHLSVHGLRRRCLPLTELTPA